MDDKSRIAIVHNWSQDDLTREVDSADLDTNKVRYQFGNHLGSSSLELDSTGQIISYEEYFAYGGTSFIAGTSQSEVKLKEYRYTGKERDDFTGLYYYGARYYAPWIGRWMSPEPLLRNYSVEKDKNGKKVPLKYINYKYLSSPGNNVYPLEPIGDKANGYVYAGNNPVVKVDPNGLEEKDTKNKEHVFIINLPGNDKHIYEEDVLNKLENMDKKPDNIAGVVTVRNAKELNKILSSLPKEVTDIIFAGGHGDKFSAWMGHIRPSDIKKNIQLPNNVKIYLWTCFQGREDKSKNVDRKLEWSKAFGVEKSQIHGFEDVAYSGETKNKIKDIINGKSVLKAHNEHVLGNIIPAILDNIFYPDSDEKKKRGKNENKQ